MRCANCGADTVGEYCHNCGQHRVAADEFAILPLVRQFGGELAHLDFKSLRSLGALLNPGVLTREFLAGRRRRYLSPLKLYFVTAALFFLAAPYVGFGLTDMLEQDNDGTLKRLVTARMAERGMNADLFTERFDLRIQTVYTLSLSASIVVTALLLRALFRGPFGANLVFALHYVSFLYLAAIALGVLTQVVGWRGPLASIGATYAVLTPYLFVALRRVYADSVVRTAVKMLVIFVATFIFDNIVNFGALLLTLWLV
jgi:hypothetical protein